MTGTKRPPIDFDRGVEVRQDSATTAHLGEALKQADLKALEAKLRAQGLITTKSQPNAKPRKGQR
jgi:hypothetical protein